MMPSYSSDQAPSEAVDATETVLSSALARLASQAPSQQIVEDMRRLQQSLLARLGTALEQAAEGYVHEPLGDRSFSNAQLSTAAQFIEPSLSAVVDGCLRAAAAAPGSSAGDAARTSLEQCREEGRRLHAHSTERVICVGDLHGNLPEVKSLWAALGDALGTSERDCATVVFLGDYCDRGPRTREVLDWLLWLRRTHRGPLRFLAGNHDFGMAAFLGSLPTAADAVPCDLERTRDPAFSSGFWPHAVPPPGLHYQGRRWAEGCVYNSDATFRSYDVPFDPAAFEREARQRLLEAVPPAHKEFLASLEWVVDLAVGGGPHAGAWGDMRRLICVHAGLEAEKPLQAQLRALRARDLSDPILHEGSGDDALPSRISAFVGRHGVMPMHPELLPPPRAAAAGGSSSTSSSSAAPPSTLLISGHHGIRMRHGGRIVLDQSGGKPETIGTYPLEALVLPEMRLIAHDGGERSLAADCAAVGYNSEANRAFRKAAKAAKRAMENGAAPAALDPLISPREVA